MKSIFSYETIEEIKEKEEKMEKKNKKFEKSHVNKMKIEEEFQENIPKIIKKPKNTLEKKNLNKNNQKIDKMFSSNNNDDI